MDCIANAEEKAEVVFVMQCVAVCCSVLQCVAASLVVEFMTIWRMLRIRVGSYLCCSVLHCVAVCCSVLQCCALCVL